MSTDDPIPPTATPLPPGPPWSVDVLADLHAGSYPPEVTAQLRRLVADDPWATSVLTALEATVDQLSLLPVPRMPERFALRLDAAIAGEQRAADDRVVPQPRQGTDQSVAAVPTYQQPAAGNRPLPPRRPPTSVGSPPMPLVPLLPPAGPAPSAVPTAPLQQPPSTASGRPAPGVTGPAAFPTSTGRLSNDRPGAPVASLEVARARRRRWIGGLAAAAAVIAIGSATVASLHHSVPTGGLAAPSSVSAPAPAPGGANGGTNALQLDPGRFGDALKQIEGRRPVGSLRDAAVYSRCLAANGIDASAVSGVTAARFAGKPAAAIAVVVDATHSRVVVVGAGCGINGAADQLAAQTVPR